MPIPAAQYLRMSTEHQQYSLENQSSAISQYAIEHGFEVVRTYADAARSGLVLKHRAGLKQLLQDVVGATGNYRAILVYDISRWGRFQDMDESAHYEFMCRQAGIQVHYIAETFANDGSVPSSIMKALKRSMAGEYSRELSVKVLAGQERMARLGFKQGGIPGYGLRRMLVGADRAPKQQLNHGERKNISTDRILLVPGPSEEIECVRLIYRLLIHEGMRVKAIARELNKRGIKYADDCRWTYGNVFNILTHPKYMGSYVYGRYTQKLHTRAVPNPPERWVVTPSAFEPIVDEKTFNRAQQILRARHHNKSNDEILAGLRKLLTAKGELSRELIEASPIVPSYSTVRFRFGSVQHAYGLIGYESPQIPLRVAGRKRIAALRRDLMLKLVAASGGSVMIVGGDRATKTRLRVASGRIISVLMCLSHPRAQGRRVWRVEPNPNEYPYVRLLVLLNRTNDAIEQIRVARAIRDRSRFFLWHADPLLQESTKLKAASDLMQVVKKVCKRSA